MPVQILPSQNAFENFRAYLLKEGFREISFCEVFKTFARLGLEAPRYHPGREVGFCFEANGWKVYVWTTFVMSLQQARLRAAVASFGVAEARKEDAGWVLITEGDKILYSTHPLRRTRYFLRRLYKYALIAKMRVINRPLCPSCQAYMDIERGKGLKSRYFICRKKAHPKPVFTNWDIGLSAWAKDFLKDERKKRALYRKKRRADGKTVGMAMLTRKRYKITRPENLLS